MIIVWLRNIGHGGDDCWVVCAKGDPGAVAFEGFPPLEDSGNAQPGGPTPSQGGKTAGPDPVGGVVKPCPNCHDANSCGDYEGPTCDVCMGTGKQP